MSPAKVSQLKCARLCVQHMAEERVKAGSPKRAAEEWAEAVLHVLWKKLGWSMNFELLKAAGPMQSLWHREQEMIGDDASDSVMKGVVTASVYEAERGMYAYSRIAPVYGEPQYMS